MWQSDLSHEFSLHTIWKFLKRIFYIYSLSTVWKTRNSLIEKKFRQINYLVISLVKPLLSRNFCENSLREKTAAISSPQCGKIKNVVLKTKYFLIQKKNSWFSTLSVAASQCGNNGNLLSLFFSKNFVNVAYLLMKLINSWFDEILFLWE